MKLIKNFNRQLVQFKFCGQYCRLTCYIIVMLFTLSGSTAFSQGLPKLTVTGTVTDSLNVKIPGVTITAENKKNLATKTDENGRFLIDVEPETILKITYVGFIDQHFTITENTKTINVILKEARGELTEVVVLAYGKKQRKEAVVGSVASIKPADLKIPASNLTNALAGQVAGVIAYQRSGQPGLDNSSFFIRGVTTFGYKVDPLILIDNVEYTSSDLARLQVDDIASFSILKDASATALYGARGANGVILISTKEGKEGKPKINFRLENSISQSGRTLELADPLTYMRLHNESIVTRNPLNQPEYTPNDILNTEATINKAPGSNSYVYPAVDWLNTLFKKSTNTQRANMSLSGGGSTAKYYIAGSYNVDNGILREDSRNNNDNNVRFKNYQLRSNVNVSVTKTTEVVIRLSGNFSEYNGPLTADGGFSTDLYNLAVHTSPVAFPAFYPLDEANANTKHILFGNTLNGGGGVQYKNPYAELLKGHKNSSESRMSAQFELNQKLDFFTEGLSLRTLFNTNRYSYFNSQMAYLPFYYQATNYDKIDDTYTLQWLNSVPGQAQEYLNYSPGPTNVNTFLYLQTSLDYTRKFAKHSISTTLVGTGQQTLYANAGSLFNSLPYRNLGLAGRASYAYNDRYFVEFNFGYNGSERFSKEHRYGFFPTIGAGWLVSAENFFAPLSGIIDRLKLRGSYGLAGNDAISDRRFFYLSDVNLNGGNFAYFGTNNGYFRNGVNINNYANPEITWETSRQTNIALEMTLFKNLNLVAEAYKSHRYNILQNRYPIASLGLEAQIPANVGMVDSRGIDLSMDYTQNFSNGAWAKVRGNYTLASNKYVQYEEPQFAEPWRYAVGQSISRGVGYIAERLFVDDEEAKNSPTQIFSANGVAPKGGDIKYRDLNQDGRIDKSDETWIGYPQTPEIVYGFGFSAGYKGFDLSAFFQGQARVSLFIDPLRVSPFIPGVDNGIGGNTQLLKAFADDHWSVNNQNLYALYPRLGDNTADLENNLQRSTWWMRDGSFMRLKSLEIGYTLPTAFAKKMKLNTCRIYFNGLNLATWSSFKLWDVEQGGNGFAYPIQKVFNIGLNVNL